jgi:hypothetical protein
MSRRRRNGTIKRMGSKVTPSNITTNGGAGEQQAHYPKLA